MTTDRAGRTTLSSEATRLEEYKALRAEIVALGSRQEARLSIASAGVAALLGLAALSRTPELACLALVLIASAWRDYLVLTDSVCRIGAYIEVVLEPALPGLGWEGVLSGAYNRDRQVKSRWSNLVRTAASSYGLFAVICAVSVVLLFGIYPPPGIFRQILAAGLVLLALSACLILAIHHFRAPERRAYWRQEFRRTAANGDCSTGTA